MTNVPSMYLLHSLGWKSAVAITVFSKSSIKRSAIMGERGEPMAKPLSCLKIWP